MNAAGEWLSGVYLCVALNAVYFAGESPESSYAGSEQGAGSGLAFWHFKTQRS